MERWGKGEERGLKGREPGASEMKLREGRAWEGYEEKAEFNGRRSRIKSIQMC